MAKAIGKGGNRIQIYPEEFVRAKGMGMHDHYTALEYANTVTNFSTRNLVNYCNSQFGRYGEDARDETCRSWCKELWRYGWLECMSEDNKVLVELNATNWKNRNKEKRKYRITNKGRRILESPQEYFINEVANVLVKTSENGLYPQCKKILDALENGIDCPINYKRGPEVVGVVKDTYKAITFGDLEPTGIIFRKNTTSWDIHQEYLEKLRRKNE
jgi:predicted transcriptional regulator